jgi:hypothetical protein
LYCAYYPFGIWCIGIAYRITTYLFFHQDFRRRLSTLFGFSGMEERCFHICTGYRIQEVARTAFSARGSYEFAEPQSHDFFLAFFPGFLWNETGNTVLQFYVLGITFMVISFIIFGGIALLAGAISRFVTKYKSVGVFMKWLQITVFVGIALFIVLP